ncbi:hypothetical protein SH139x_004289 [Planctomycetaceae bacterium SH139]
MWHTPTGKRVVDGVEAELIRESISTILEQLLCSSLECEDFCFQSGIEVFDCLPLSQKLASLELAGRHLLTDTEDALPLTAVNESVVGVIFENIRQHIETEIDTERCYEACFGDEDSAWEEDSQDCFPGDRYWRRQVLVTCRQTLGKDPAKQCLASEFDWPPVECDDLQRWDVLIELLADRILWDRDYEMAEAFLDDAPENATAKKLMLGIDEDYFTGLAPDPRDEVMDQVVLSIRRLTRPKPR